MFFQLAAGFCTLSMLGVRCGNSAGKIKQDEGLSKRLEMQNLIRPLFDALEPIIKSVRRACFEVYSHERLLNEKIEGLQALSCPTCLLCPSRAVCPLSPECPVDFEAATIVIDQIWVCAEEAYALSSVYPDLFTDREPIEERIDDVDNCLVEVRDVLSKVLGRSQIQGGDSGSRGVEVSNSNQVFPPIQYTASSSSRNLGSRGVASFSRTAGTQVSTASAPDLQDSFGRALDFVTECSHMIRTEIDRIRERYKLLVDHIIKIQELIISSHGESEDSVWLKTLRGSASELQGEYGPVYGALDESLRGVDGLLARLRIEWDAFDQALLAHFGSTSKIK
ncbi:hypothetical protein PAPHI01_0124 [Pancytospora philotis]|nr:hypothetical protein PAPHI01_0124 [Pancytospora philotis]